MRAALAYVLSQSVTMLIWVCWAIHEKAVLELYELPWIVTPLGAMLEGACAFEFELD